VTLVAWVAQSTALFANTGVNIWMPTLLRDLGYSGGSLYAVTAIISSGVLLFAIIGFFLVDRVGRRPLLIISPLGTLVCVPLLGFAGTAPELAAAGLLANGLNLGLLLSPLNTWLAEGYPTSIRAAGAGWSQMPGRVASFAAPPFIGLLIAAGASMPAIFLALGLPSAITLALMVLLVRESRGNYLEVAG
jgi:MFS family permease